MWSCSIFLEQWVVDQSWDTLIPPLLSSQDSGQIKRDGLHKDCFVVYQGLPIIVCVIALKRDQICKQSIAVSKVVITVSILLWWSVTIINQSVAIYFRLKIAFWLLKFYGVVQCHVWSWVVCINELALSLQRCCVHMTTVLLLLCCVTFYKICGCIVLMKMHAYCMFRSPWRPGCVPRWCNSSWSSVHWKECNLREHWRACPVH